jgi:hypothetical protein
MRLRLRSLAAGGLVLGAACSPALDWREVRPEGSGASAWFPCRPASHARGVTLAGQQVHLTLLACSAGGSTWALAHAELHDAVRVGQALLDLRAAAVSNLGAEGVRPIPGRVEGETPNASAGRFEFVGERPGGGRMREQIAVFARGTRVFQATALGSRLDDRALEVFFDGLRVNG